MPKRLVPRHDWIRSESRRAYVCTCHNVVITDRDLFNTHPHIDLSDRKRACDILQDRRETETRDNTSRL